MMAHFRSRYYTGTRRLSYYIYIQQFTFEYPNETIEYDRFARHRNRLVQRFIETGIFAKHKPVGALRVLSELLYSLKI